MQVSSILTRNLKTISFLFTIFFALFAISEKVEANLGPEDCFLVVNGDSDLSRRIANEYIHLRKIPAKNVLVLKGVPVKENISGDDFLSKMLRPTLKAINDRKLGGQIECVIYSADFPTRCNIKKWTKGQKYMSPIASTTSLTYLYRYSLAKSPSVISLENNFYARRGPNVVLNQPFASKKSKEPFDAVLTLYKEKKYKEAEKGFASILEKNPAQCGLCYWRARCFARLGDHNNASKHLIEAISRGWRFKDFTEKDDSFEKMKGRVVFKAALKSIKGVQWQFTNPVPFSAKITWAHSGFPEFIDDSPNKYLLCTMLGVKFEKGNSEKEMLIYLRRSATADNKGPRKGWFFFADTSDVRNRTRKPNYAAALKSLKAMGYQGIIEKSILPKKSGTTLGATIGKSIWQWKTSKAKLAAGAIGDNLTSHGGQFHKTNKQMPLSEFLRHGAAGASGTVNEPYALQSKFPLPSIHAYYASGLSLVESFYLSVNGPYQLLIVGDALCQPFARPPKISLKGIQSGATVRGRVEIAPEFSGKKAKGYIFYFDGKAIRMMGPDKKIRFDSSKHADGYHEIRVVAVGADPSASKSRLIIPVMFNNRSEKCHFKVTIQGKKLKLQAAAKGASKIEIWHQSELLHQSKKSPTTVMIPIEKVGRGPVTLHAAAKFGKKSVKSKPMSVVIKGKSSKK